MGRDGEWSEFPVGTPQGNPETLRGAPPSGVGAVVSGPLRYVINGAGSIPYAEGDEEPGVLGETPPALLGIYDRRPWEGIPGKANAKWYRQAVKSVIGESLTVRIIAEPAQARANYQPNTSGWFSPWRWPCLSLIVAGWETADAATIEQPFGVPVVPSNPFSPGSDAWFPARLARLGPNVLGELVQTNRAEVDVGAWAGGARFVAVWLWAYWIGDMAGTLPVTASVLGRPRFEFERWQPQAVSFPVRVVQDGPLPVIGALENYALWRAGAFPWRGGPTLRRLAVVNGGPAPVTVLSRYLLGPHPDSALYTGLDVRPTIAPGATWIDATTTAADLAGYTATGYYGAHNVNEGFSGGPIIITTSGAG
jgi:hypothetical protein